MIKKIASIEFRILLPVFLFISSFIIEGCNQSNQESILERNKQLVLTMNDELWNKGNLDKMNNFFSSDFVLHFLPGGSEVRGIDSLKEHEKKHRVAFPDWLENIRHIVAEGDLVIIHFVSTGTNKGNWLGDPPTGKRIKINEMSIFRIKNEKIVEQWLLPDLFSMQQQLTLTGKE